MSTGLAPSSSEPHHPLCGICLAEVISGSAPTAPLAVNLQANSLSVKCCLPTLLSQVLAVAAALRGSNPEPQSVGTTVVKMLPLGNRGGRPIEKVWAARQSRGGLLPAEGVAASPCVRAWLALSTSLGAWEAGLGALSLSGDQEKG